MILKNKKMLLLASLATLLPIPAGLLLWNQFPADYLNHFAFTVFLPPLTLLVAQWLCVFLSALDKSNKDRNQKSQAMVLWIIPFLSCLVSGILYGLLLGIDFSPMKWMIWGMGLLFVVIGNYLPKTRTNSTIGIKVSWTYSSEENWNATHRFAGKVWVAGGLVMILCGLLPEGWAIGAMFVILLVMILLPLWYTHRYYRKELAEGKDVKAGYSPVDKRIGKVSLVFLAVLLVFMAAILWSGDLEYRFEENAFTVEADWYADLTMRYDSIQAVEYRDGNVDGMRVGGFNSMRLLMGWFQNEEFGIYSRYTYYKPESCVVLTTKEKTLVLSGKTAADTQAIYDALLAQIN